MQPVYRGYEDNSGLEGFGRAPEVLFDEALGGYVFDLAGEYGMAGLEGGLSGNPFKRLRKRVKRSFKRLSRKVLRPAARFIKKVGPQAVLTFGIGGNLAGRLFGRGFTRTIGGRVVSKGLFKGLFAKGGGFATTGNQAARASAKAIAKAAAANPQTAARLAQVNAGLKSQVLGIQKALGGQSVQAFGGAGFTPAASAIATGGVPLATAEAGAALAATQKANRARMLSHSLNRQSAAMDVRTKELFDKHQTMTSQFNTQASGAYGDTGRLPITPDQVKQGTKELMTQVDAANKLQAQANAANLNAQKLETLASRGTEAAVKATNVEAAKLQPPPVVKPPISPSVSPPTAPVAKVPAAPAVSKPVIGGTAGKTLGTLVGNLANTLLLSKLGLGRGGIGVPGGTTIGGTDIVTAPPQVSVGGSGDEGAAAETPPEFPPKEKGMSPLGLVAGGVGVVLAGYAFYTAVRKSPKKRRR